MPYRLIKGSFHLFYHGTRAVGSQPDGDSVWFKPKDQAALLNLGGREPKYNKGGFLQLRFEAIDALEIHFNQTHQNLENASAARDFNLNDIGFKKVEFSKSGFTVKSASPHPIDGYILARSIDPYGRPVSFVFSGSHLKPHGSDIFLDVKLLNNSINAELSRSGQAFPTFYTGLPVDLRNQIKKLINSSKNGKMWKADKSFVGMSTNN
jgi:hypothetical protein